jgi:hypothetical protein
MYRMNAVEEVLNEMAATGRVLSRAEIRTRIASDLRGPRHERDAVVDGVYRAGLKIRNVLGDEDADDADETIANLIGATVEKYASADAGRRDAAAIAANSPGPELDARRAAARQRNAVIAPLHEVLTIAGPSGGVDPRDLAALNLAAGTTAAERTQWEKDVAAAGAKVAEMYAAGQQGASREVARRLAQELGGALAPVGGERDPLADERDPRRLADAVKNRP